MTGLRILALSLVAMATVSINAQDRTKPMPAPAPRLVVQGDNLQPIKITYLSAMVRIHGCAAETSLTMVFNNPNNRQLAGTLYCPLPEGAVITGYGLNIHGKMVDGVVVERQKARQVFEKEVRKNVDPGLVESVKGNNFKTRVYPIPPNGHRTIRVSYLNELDVTDGTPTFTLPLNFSDTLDTFKMRVEIAEGTVSPKVTGGPSNVTFKKWKRQLVAENSYRNISLTEDLVIAIPKTDRIPVSLEAAADGTYMVVDCTPPSPKSRAHGSGPASKWKAVTLFWDASMSRKDADHELEFELLRKLFAKRNAKMEVHVVTFRNLPDQFRSFTVLSGVESLIKYLKTVRYDGGTQIGALSLPKGNQDAVLLFSDGVSNFGKADPTAALTCPVYAFNSSTTGEHAFLKDLGRKTGGQYYNLKGATTTAVVDALFAAEPTMYLRAELNGKPIADAYPLPNTPIPVAGKAFRFAAKLPATAKPSTLTLTFRVDGKTVSIPMTVDPGKTIKGQLLRTFYGRMKINDLLVSRKTNEKALVEAGKTYGMVTPGTSLLVLDTLDQYVEHRVAPPKSLSDMRASYFDQVEALGKAKKTAEFKRIEEVVTMWDEVCTWYTKEFKYDLAEMQRAGAAARGDGGIEREVVEELVVEDEVVEESIEFVGPMGGRSSAGRRMAVGRHGGSSNAGTSAPVDVSDDAPQTDDEVLDVVATQSALRGSADGVSSMASRFEDTQQAALAKIAIKEWTPDTPYLKVLQRTGEKAYDNYLDMRKEYGTAPSYYLDCADFFLRKGDKSLGLRVLSNITEMELENAALLRVMAHRLTQLGKLELAAMAFEEVLRLRPEEPQSLRDLALVLADLKRYDHAITLLYDLALKRWDRFQEIEKIALVELNRIYAKAVRENVKLTVEVDPRLLRLIDVDVRIVMTWDADMTDMDLWVTEPSAEKCYYSHNRTVLGGRMSRDFTQGYGPEEYLLKKSPNGKYLIQTNYYGSRARSVIGPVTLQATVFTNYGRADETRQSLTIRLSKNKEVVTIGNVTIGKDGTPTIGQTTHYQIKRRDTLRSIAKNTLGDAASWKRILEVNPGLDPKNLTTGMIITLPKK